jgi:hypothetical protein
VAGDAPAYAGQPDKTRRKYLQYIRTIPVTARAHSQHKLNNHQNIFYWEHTGQKSLVQTGLSGSLENKMFLTEFIKICILRTDLISIGKLFHRVGICTSGNL